MSKILTCAVAGLIGLAFSTTTFGQGAPATPAAPSVSDTIKGIAEQERDKVKERTEQKVEQKKEKVKAKSDKMQEQAEKKKEQAVEKATQAPDKATDKALDKVFGK